MRHRRRSGKYCVPLGVCGAKLRHFFQIRNFFAVFLHFMIKTGVSAGAFHDKKQPGTRMFRAVISVEWWII